MLGYYGCDGLTESEGEVNRRFVSNILFFRLSFTLINEHDVDRFWVCLQEFFITAFCVGKMVLEL